MNEIKVKAKQTCNTTSTENNNYDDSKHPHQIHAQLYYDSVHILILISYSYFLLYAWSFRLSTNFDSFIPIKT